MTKTKALLLSAFVFPGLGQCSIKRYIVGIPIVVLTTVAVLFIVALLVTISGNVVALIQSGELAATPAVLHEEIYTQLYAYGVWPELAIYTIVLVWLISIVDLALYSNK